MTNIVSASPSHGLGNQLFMMAAAFGYAKRHGRECVIYEPNTAGSWHTHINYLDTVFKNFKRVHTPIDYTHEDGTNILAFNGFPTEDAKLHHIHLHGYYQNEEYLGPYKQEFVDLLVLPWSKPIPHTAFIHVRRGDYVNNPYGLHQLSDTYRANALNFLKQLRPEVKIKAISDDNDWCKTDALLKTHGVKTHKPSNEIDTLMFMAACEIGGITANSTFSWWGAFLNKHLGKVIILPEQWVLKNMYHAVPQMSGAHIVSDEVVTHYPLLYSTAPTTTSDVQSPSPSSSYDDHSSTNWFQRQNSTTKWLLVGAAGLVTLLLIGLLIWQAVVFKKHTKQKPLKTLPSTTITVTKNPVANK
jgi:hypothetical protein